jgi:hypothetical protein
MAFDSWQSASEPSWHCSLQTQTLMAALFRVPAIESGQVNATKVLNSGRGVYPAAEHFLAQ